MTFDSTGNGNMSEIGEIVEKKIKDPGRFINYDVDRRMASFRPQGGIHKLYFKYSDISIKVFSDNCQM